MKWHQQMLLELMKIHYHRPGPLVFHYDAIAYYKSNCIHCSAVFYVWDRDIGLWNIDDDKWNERYKFTYTLYAGNGYELYGNLYESYKPVRLEHLICDKLKVML